MLDKNNANTWYYIYIYIYTVEDRIMWTGGIIGWTCHILKFHLLCIIVHRLLNEKLKIIFTVEDAFLCPWSYKTIKCNVQLLKLLYGINLANSHKTPYLPDHKEIYWSVYEATPTRRGNPKKKKNNSVKTAHNNSTQQPVKYSVSATPNYVTKTFTEIPKFTFFYK